MKRRAFIAGALGVSASLSGCVGLTVEGQGDINPYPFDRVEFNATMTTDSEYFRSVSYYHEPAFLGDIKHMSVGVTQKMPEPLSAIVVTVNGEQHAYSEVNTGEGFVEIDVDLERFADDGFPDVELLAVQGGKGEWGSWNGGEVLERTTINVEKQEGG